MPPFDPDLSLGMLTADKMSPVTRVGPLERWFDDLKDRTIRFLPSKSDLIAGSAQLDGYLIAAGRYNVRVYAVGHDGTRYYLQSGDVWLDLDNTDPDAFTLAADVVKGSERLNVYRFDGGRRHFASINSGPSPEGLPAPLIWDDGKNLQTMIWSHFTTSQPPRVVGVAFVPDIAPAFDRVFFLWYDEEAASHREAVYQTDSTTDPLTIKGLVSGTELRAGMLPGLPTGIESGFYGHHAASGASYLSVYDPAEGRYRTYRWDDTFTATELPGLAHRVEAVLSNGRLFCRDGSMGYVYDSEGRRVNRFPLGGLCLACEITAGPIPRLYFTLPGWEHSDHDQSSLTFLVYSLPTDEIDRI
jgi:hypothetical protein